MNRLMSLVLALVATLALATSVKAECGCCAEASVRLCAGLL